MMHDELNPPAILSNVERAAQLIQEARAIDGIIKLSIRATADQMMSRGTALIKAQKLSPKGEFDAMLARYWPEITRRTAYRNMKLATEKARSDMVSLFESYTHRQLDDKPCVEDSSEDGKPTLTANERKILISLIGTVKPGLAKKLRDGTKKITDAQLKEECPPSCDRCMRGDITRNCSACERKRADHQASLFEEQQEPANPDDSTSAPAPTPDPYAEAKKLTTKLTDLLTKLLGNDAKLYEALVACRVVDHLTGQTPRLRALSGLRKVIDLVEKGETDLKVIKHEYDVASGSFVPPKFEKRR